MSTKKIWLVPIIVLPLGVALVLWLNRVSSGPTSEYDPTVENYTPSEGRAQELLDTIQHWTLNAWQSRETRRQYETLQNSIDNAAEVGNIQDDDKKNLRPILLNGFVDKVKRGTTAFFSSSTAQENQANLLLDDVRYLKDQNEYGSEKKVRAELENLNYFNQLRGMASRISAYKNTKPLDIDQGVLLADEINSIQQRGMLAQSPLATSIADGLRQELRGYMVLSIQSDLNTRVNAYVGEERYSPQKTQSFEQELSRLSSNSFLGVDARLNNFISGLTQELANFTNFKEAIDYKVKVEARYNRLNCSDLCGKYKAYLPVCDSIHQQYLSNQ